MPADLFVGGRLDSVVVFSGTPAEVTGGVYDATYADCAIRCPGNGDGVRATFRDAALNPVDLAVGQVGYSHFEFRPQGTGTVANQNLVEWCDSADNPWLAIRCAVTNALTFGLFYNSGTVGAPVWTQIGANFALGSGTLYTFDLVLGLGAPHTVTLYQNSATVLVAPTNFAQALFTTVRAAKLRGTGNIFSDFSQLYFTEGRSTLGAKVKYSRANAAAAANTGWGGANTNVNEAVNSDATTDSTTNAGVRQTYPMSDVAVPAGFIISSVWHWLRGKNDGAAPQNIKSAVRIGGANYDAAANVPGIGVAFSALPARYDVSPVTGVAWTQAEYNGAEFGYLSAA